MTLNCPAYSSSWEKWFAQMPADREHIHHVVRHRNIFESNTPYGETPDERDDSSSTQRTVNSAKGKPCILGAKCHCICRHNHHFGRASVTNDDSGVSFTADFTTEVTETHDHCPVHGAAYFS